MTYSGEMVLPRNAVMMQEEELRCVEGGRPLSKGQKKICQKASNRTKKIDRKVGEFVLSLVVGKMI